MGTATDMIRCKLCLYPQGKPDLAFDAEGVCSACRNYANRPQIDWEQREAELVAILDLSRREARGPYDCIVPSSGGKDSHYQVLKLIELGARPLVVTASTCLLTPVGRLNIENLKRYATTIEVSPQRRVRRQLCRLGLELVGDISWPEHATIFTVPLRMAKAMGIPLVFYGENPQAEYGGPIGAEQARGMTERWVSEFGGFLGLRANDFIGREGITEADMAPYQPLQDFAGLEVYFLGQFLPWDSRENAHAASAAGFYAPVPPPCDASLWNFENLDNAMTGLHDHGMYRKYGYGRFAAQASHDIRRGEMTREKALQRARWAEGRFPEKYANVLLREVLECVKMTREQLFAALDAHTNWDLFARVESGRPILKEWAGDAENEGDSNSALQGA